MRPLLLGLAFLSAALLPLGDVTAAAAERAKPPPKRAPAPGLVGRWAQYGWRDRDRPQARPDATLEFRADGTLIVTVAGEPSRPATYRLGGGDGSMVRALELSPRATPGTKLNGIVQLFGDVAKLEMVEPGQPSPRHFSDALHGSTPESLVVLRRLSASGEPARGDLDVSGVRAELVGTWYVLPWSSAQERSKHTIEFTAGGEVHVRGSVLWGDLAAWDGTYQLNPSVFPIWLDLEGPRGRSRGLLQQMGSTARLELFDDLGGAHPTEFQPELPAGSLPNPKALGLVRVPAGAEASPSPSSTAPAAPPAGAAATSPQAPGGAAPDRSALEKEAIDLAQRRLDAYNAKELVALLALYDDDYTAWLHGPRYGKLTKVSSDGTKALMPAAHKKAALAKAYGADFQSNPGARLQVVTRRVTFSPVLQVVETLEAAPSSTGAAIGFELGEVQYTIRGGRLQSGSYFPRAAR